MPFVNIFKKAIAAPISAKHSLRIGRHEVFTSKIMNLLYVVLWLFAFEGTLLFPIESTISTDEVARFHRLLKRANQF